MEIEKLKSIVESLLFVSGEPIKILRLAKIAGVSGAEIENAVMALQNDYGKNRGFFIIKKGDEAQMTSQPENADYVSKLIKAEVQDNLSQSALEVLSIIAYRSPISRAGIEAIRGVNSTFTLRTLLMRGMLEREENPTDNRSYIYRISFEFLKKMGIEKIEDLPDWKELSKDARIENVLPDNNFDQAELHF